jgi:hypothetical protein
MGGRKPRKLPRQILGEILEPRMEEIFTLIKREIYRAGMENLINSGVVLTGGTALLDGITEIAESVFNLPTRLGAPQRHQRAGGCGQQPHVRHRRGAGALRGQEPAVQEVPDPGRQHLQPVMGRMKRGSRMSFNNDRCKGNGI